MKNWLSRLRFYLSWFLISTLISFISHANEYNDASQLNVSESEFNDLWSIAVDLKSEFTNLSVYQIMIAIQDLNKSSFNKNNVNLLKKSSVLKIPSPSFVETFDTSRSILEVARQNSLIDSKFTYFSILESRSPSTLVVTENSLANIDTLSLIHI